MNILELLKVNIEDEYFFFNQHSSVNDRKNMKKVVGDFLNCDDERHREALANILTNYALQPNAKGAEIAPLMGVMNMIELFGSYSYKKNRKHSVHQVNVFLLGLLLYNNIKKIKDNVDREMEFTANKTYSSGDVKGEFLFRWKLASLTHDLGNGISLFGNDKKRINDYIFYLQLLSNERWGWNYDGVDKLIFLDNGRESLVLLDKVDGSDHLKKFFNYLKSKPFKKIYYDHGVMSAILLLKILDVMYSKYKDQTIEYKGHMVSFKKAYYDKSIVQVAYAISIHNLDFYPNILLNIWGTKKIYNFNLRPFSWLLKICDTLQEWNKSKAKNEADYVTPEKIEFELLNDSVLVRNYPEKEKLSKKLDEFFVANNIIKIV